MHKTYNIEPGNNLTIDGELKTGDIITVARNYQKRTLWQWLRREPRTLIKYTIRENPAARCTITQTKQEEEMNAIIDQQREIKDVNLLKLQMSSMYGKSNRIITEHVVSTEWRDKMLRLEPKHQVFIIRDGKYHLATALECGNAKTIAVAPSEMILITS